jgi:hypothetical protein
MAAAATGDVVLLAVLLGIAAGDVIAGVVAGAASLSVLVRWGGTSLQALAGAQAVLGGAGWTGPAGAALSSWAAAAALVLVSPRGWLPSAAFGLTAAVVVAGPGIGGAVAVRAGASLAGVLLARLAGDLPAPARRMVALAAAVCALAFALVP